MAKKRKGFPNTKIDVIFLTSNLTLIVTLLFKSCDATQTDFLDNNTAL